jgi:uncharacterized protein (DUF2267 family)
VSSEFYSENLLNELFGEAPTESIRNQQKQIIEDVSSMIEYSFLASPLSSLLGFLTENARNAVLSTSIRKSSFEDGLPKLVAAIWMADIDSKSGKAALIEQVKLLPTAIFLRAVLCTHLIHRVYWHQWRQEDRTALLEVAEIVFRAMDKQIDREEIEKQLKEISSALAKD